LCCRCGYDRFPRAGQVYYLEKLSEFAGNYLAASAGATVVEGRSAISLMNEHGVIIKLVATEVGLKFNLSTDGVQVSLTG